MKSTINVNEITHKELVNIFSAATYGNSMMGICVANDSKALEKALKADSNINTECIEDVWAEVLLNGGNLCIIDAESEAEDEADAKKHAYNGNTHKVGFMTLNGFWGEYGATTYELNLTEFLKGCGSQEAYNYLMTLIEDDGDMWDGYNLMQLIVFGDLIYG